MGRPRAGRPVGRRPGGYFRQPFTAPERELRGLVPRAVRRARPARRGRRLRQPRRLVGRRRRARPCSPARTSTRCSTAGRTTARSASSPRWPRSTCCASRGVVPARPIGVSVFVEEEGSRFGLACLGSRLATGAMSLGGRAGAARPGRRRPRGRRRGRRPRRCSTASAPSWSCTSSRAATSSTAARRSGWPARSGRTGATASTSPARPTTPGTTRMEDRADPMLTYAMTALAANKQARLAGQRATFGRVEVDAQRHQRGAVAGAGLAGRAVLDRRRARGAGRGDHAAGDRARRRATAPTVTVTAESVSGAVAFDPALAALVAADHEGGDWPVIPTAGRPRRRHPLRGRHPDRDALRPQPDRRLALARPSTPRSPTAWPASTRWPTPSSGWPGDGRSAYLLERAWVDGAVRDDVLVEIDGRAVHARSSSPDVRTSARVSPAGR